MSVHVLETGTTRQLADFTSRRGYQNSIVYYHAVGCHCSILAAVRKQFIRRSVTTSRSTVMGCGVPEGWVLGPIMFVLHMVDFTVRDRATWTDATPLYADESHIYGFCQLCDTNLRR